MAEVVKHNSGRQSKEIEKIQRGKEEERRREVRATFMNTMLQHLVLESLTLDDHILSFLLLHLCLSLLFLICMATYLNIRVQL